MTSDAKKKQRIIGSEATEGPCPRPPRDPLIISKSFGVIHKKSKDHRIKGHGRPMRIATWGQPVTQRRLRQGTWHTSVSLIQLFVVLQKDQRKATWGQ